MATRREQIIVAVKALLVAIKTGQPVLNIKRVDRSFADKYAGADAPSINLTPDQEQPTENGTGPVDARLDIEVAVFHRGTEPDSLADPIVEAVHAAVMAASLPNALDITEGPTSWDFDESDRTQLLVRMRFTVWYRHSRSALAA